MSTLEVAALSFLCGFGLAAAIHTRRLNRLEQTIKTELSHYDLNRTYGVQREQAHAPNS